jgi:hypothetical protein
MADATQTSPTKAARARKTGQSAKKPATRVRKKAATVRKKAATASAQGPTNEAKDVPTPRPASLVGVAALTVAMILGAAGFALHFFWVGAIVVMAVLWGSMLAGRQVGARNPRGVVSEVVTAAVDEVREITDSLSGTDTEDVGQSADA